MCNGHARSLFEGGGVNRFDGTLKEDNGGGGRRREEEYASELDGLWMAQTPIGINHFPVLFLLIEEALSFARMNGWGGSVGKIIASLRSVGIGGDTLKENSQHRDVVTDVSTGHITNGSLSQLIRR